MAAVDDEKEQQEMGYSTGGLICIQMSILIFFLVVFM
jgi:hypothetical protein